MELLVYEDPIVFDIEANGFDATKIHCLSAMTGKGLKSTSSYKSITAFCNRAKILVGHNIIRYDVPTLERILNVKIEGKLVDTLALSWYLFPNRNMHGLGDWGEEFGVPKPVIDDWDGLSTEEYIHRCEEDVKINTKLWKKCWSYLLRLYGSEEEAWRLIDYLTFKMLCVHEQEQLRWKFDVPRAEKLLEKLLAERTPKVEALIKVMPEVPVMATRKPPAKPYKQDGTMSASGINWLAILRGNNLPIDHNDPVDVVTKYKPPNPGSSDQVKSWLYSFGWIPESFDYKRDKETGEVRTIPQVRKDYGEGKELCHSVVRLVGKEPSIVILEGLTILDHRIAMIRGMLKNADENGYLKASMQGFTNTLRLKHRELVNLPGIDKPYGGDIRGCLICPDGYVLVGSDMSSLEDRTKQHYMWPHDPDYVKAMMVPDFDPHIDLAVFAKALTVQEGNDHKSGKVKQSRIRKMYKQANYACVYGAGGATVARGAGISDHEGGKLVTAYWKRNWSVEVIAEEQVVKSCSRQQWLFNPVSKLWYSLRHEKDRFSTLNQGTGVFCFDTWVKYQRQKGLPVCGQFHDETINLVKKEMKHKAADVLRWAIRKTNEELQLSRELDIDVQFGTNYAEIH